MTHLIAAMVLSVLLLYIAALYESTALALLGFSLSGLMIAALLLLILRLTALRMDIAIPMTLSESGCPVGVRFEVQAKRKMLGKTRLRVCVEARQLPGKKKKRIWMELDAPSLGTEIVRKEVTMHCAGGYEYCLRKVRVYDWTGWFYLTKRVNCTATTMILPQVHELPLHLSAAVREFFGEAEIYDDLRGGTDTSQVFQIRGYMPGDRLQNIHWKLSAKSEDLMVREHSLPRGSAIVLLLGSKGIEKQTPAQRDRFLQIAVSLSFSLVDAQCPHIVTWYDEAAGDLVRTRVDDEEGFYEWQFMYLNAQMKCVCVDVESLYEKKYRSEPCLHRLRVEPKAELYLDGKLWHSFAKKGSPGDELKALELYL